MKLKLKPCDLYPVIRKGNIILVGVGHHLQRGMYGSSLS